MHAMVKGLLAGAAGTLVLDVVTYGDMLVRGRSSSGLPAQVAERLAGAAGVPLGGEGTRDNRAQAAGALLGYATGVVTGTVYGLLHRRRPPLPVLAGGPLLGAAAMAGRDAPAVALRLTDPASWDVMSWVSDIVPHLAYGLTTAAVYQALG
jgi:xanthosine utilization system XapX-like protein